MKLLLCDRCQFPIEKNTSFFSRYTGNRYCNSFKECERRTNNDLTPAEISWKANQIISKLEGSFQ
jgi:hypothetical protein